MNIWLIIAACVVCVGAFAWGIRDAMKKAPKVERAVEDEVHAVEALPAHIEALIEAKVKAEVAAVRAEYDKIVADLRARLAHIEGKLKALIGIGSASKPLKVPPKPTPKGAPGKR